jgi:3-hydroxyacyl-CoA dehydrogenase
MVTDVAGVVDGADAQIEAVPERVELKRTVLAAAEARGPALLASNTSSIPIGTLAAGRLGRKSGHGFYRCVDGRRVD